MGRDPILTTAERNKPSARAPCSTDMAWSNCGRISIGKRKINLSRVFAGQLVGIKCYLCLRYELAPLSPGRTHG